MAEVSLEISNILNRLLTKVGISEAELGREIGLPRATINRIASGRTPDPRASTLNSIAGYFNVSVDQLLGKQPIFTETKSSGLSNAYATIPVIDWSSAKIWKQTLENICPSDHFNWILTDPNINNGKFALEIKGEAMWPQFQENTTLIIDPIREAKNRDFVIAHIKKNDSVLFRQLMIDGEYAFIKAINKIFPTVQLKECDNIIGVVIQARNNLG